MSSQSIPDPRFQPPLGGYEVLVCVAGGIAAYKTAAVVSGLVQAGASVSVALTRNGRRFVGVETFRALTGRHVHTTMWGRAAPEFGHLTLSETADLIVVAPATANIIGKLAGGIADDLVSTLLIGADCPILMAPAMNTRMWRHGAVQRNVQFLKELGIQWVGPATGRMACGTEGPGRMAEPEDLLAEITRLLKQRPPRILSRKDAAPPDYI